MEERYIATMILHAVGDTIGFNNGKWEFNDYISPKAQYEILYEFISLGGINDINLQNWIVSDDTVMHIATSDALISNHQNYDKYIDALKRAFLDSDLSKERFPGITTIKSLKKMQNNIDLSYNTNSGGSGCSMRNLCIGLLFNGIQNRKKLIKYSIGSSIVTHYSAIAYLGGLTSALFTAYAIENIKPEKWCFKLLKILSSNYILSIINRTNNMDEKNDYTIFINKWKKYIELRFDNNGNFINHKNFYNMEYRTFFFGTHFTRQGFQDENIVEQIGANGYSSVIMAYDCLLVSKNCWEKLIIYSVCHSGDSDTVACIACGWFGALYGLKYIPSSNTKFIEFKNILIKNAKKLFQLHKKYSK